MKKGRVKKIIEESKALEQKQKDLQAELDEIEAKRAEDLKEIQEYINEKYDGIYYAGVVISFDDALTILKQTKEFGSVRLPMNIYMEN